ncbi:hypothetical protein OLX02_19895 [Novosphingobium sp. KCTC 2891]|uniref:hypothetical protein n=1 Tax=Novosphingobium sp. TaxID=1874826 RepID=UPI0038BC5368|nr:hypothetical protein [Novosphingobium sp. KCTC 2891]
MDTEAQSSRFSAVFLTDIKGLGGNRGIRIFPDKSLILNDYFQLDGEGGLAKNTISN